MIAAWMLWSVGAGLLFLVAGLAMERIFDGGRRWIWMGAGIGTVGLTAMRVSSGGGSGRAAVAEAGGALEMTPVGAAAVEAATAPTLSWFPRFAIPDDSFLLALDGILLLGWVMLSFGLVLWALVGTADLLHRRRFWEPGTLLGRSVLWARDAGPAVVGFLRPRVVLPTWVRGVEPSRQKLILAHEEEHLGAGDAVVRFFAAVLLIAFPWNPALWLQHRRLCLAIELDCDQRVMERLPHRRWLYGDLLFRVGSRFGAGPGLALAGFAERSSFLERRIRKLLGKAPEVGMAQIAFLAFAAIMVVGVAVWAPGITKEMRVTEPVPELEVEPELVTNDAIRFPLPPSADDVSLQGKPRFVVHTVKPRLLNPAEVNRVLEREYPALLRDAGIGGTTTVHLFVEESGRVGNALVKNSSEHAALDQAALKVSRAARFSPGMDRDRAALWIEYDITFRAN